MSLFKSLIFVLTLSAVTAVGFSAHAQSQTTLFSNDYELRDKLFTNTVRKLEAIWRARLYGETVNMQTQNSELAGFDAYLETKYMMLENLEARVFFRGKFESGRSQSLFGDLVPANGILVREAALKYMPFSFFDVKAGVISQDFLDMPQMLYRATFPGAIADLHAFIAEDLQIGINAEYSIPSSQTLSPRTVGAEATPTFTNQTLYIEYDDEVTRVFAKGTFFEFKNLPSFVAFESQKYGNSYTTINGPNNSQFLFPFKGWFGNIGGSRRFTDLYELFASYRIIKNEKAPETYNDGHMITIDNRFHTENYVFGVGAQSFFLESDAAPSFYTPMGYGNTNKKGQGFELSVQFTKYNFRVRGQFYEADVINPNGIQQDQKYFFLGVETGYDRI